MNIPGPWRRLADGREALAFYRRPESGAWVAWTPEGYYWASLEGGELLEWVVNDGPDRAPDAFPAERFKARLHRPERIRAVLERPGADRSAAAFFQADRLRADEGAHETAWFVHMGSYHKVSAAQKVLDWVMVRGITGHLRPVMVKGRRFLRVLAGPYPVRERAREAMAELRKVGMGVRFRLLKLRD